MGSSFQPALPFPTERKILTISELTRRIKRLVEEPLRFVTVTGEISNYKKNHDGNRYFTLKDDEASLSCVLWKEHGRLLSFEPGDGMEVLAWGSIEIYPRYGRYQLYVQGMEPKGVGALQLRFEQLKEKLDREGLFDPSRKRPLPFLPGTIAIVTSPTGAAIQDMLRTLLSRFPRAHVALYPVRVQGEGAAEEIAAAIRHINAERPDIDVIIAGRGGGSIEDLWAFNEEVVARAIHQSRIPVVSAVGHETDFTIADFVADVRALTPTDAANKVIPRLEDLQERLEDLRHKLRRTLQSRAEMARTRLHGLENSYALRSPGHIVRAHRQRLDELEERLRGALAGTPGEWRTRLERLRGGLDAGISSVRELIRQRPIERERRALDRAVGSLVQARRRDVEARLAHLTALDPRAILRRGYSITYDSRGRIIADAASVKAGEAIRSVLGKGELRSRVEDP
ncbi:MAG: exodeoxyribonuclease VII large subunit [Planctomycetes bacterium]|nr:exodeoxyribonuclease VII large subunit [Planctomycetota bacterium]